MKHRGTLFVEALIGVAIFLIGVMAVASALAFSLRSIVQSRQAISADMSVSNIAEYNAMRLAISPDETPVNMNIVTGGITSDYISWTKITHADGTQPDNSTLYFRFKCNLYGCKADDKYKTAFYILRESE